MTIRALIVDDEALARTRLRQMIGDIAEVELVAEAANAEEAKAAIEKFHPDLVFLDIQMPGKSGLAMAADLPLDGRAEIVFVTAFEHFAPDAFEVEAADYLLKPVRLDRLRQAVARVQRRRALLRAANLIDPDQDSGEFLEEFWVPVRGGKARVAVDMIEWIEAAKDYVVLHTALRSYLHRASMNELERGLDPRKLVRVHRSAFVAPQLVAQIERPAKGVVMLKLRDGAEVQVGPSYVKDVLRRLTGEN